MSGKVMPPGPVTAGLRIGLLGGSFNPAHEGHVHASKLALEQLKLDYVWWLVSPQNPLKGKQEMAPLIWRYTMAKNGVKDPRIRVSDIEKALGTRYTVDTLAALKKRFPGVHFIWLMGSDTFVQFPKWKRWQDIFQLAPIAVVPRPGTTQQARRSIPAQVFKKNRVLPKELPDEAPGWTVLSGRGVPASSTEIRRHASWNR